MNQATPIRRSSAVARLWMAVAKHWLAVTLTATALLSLGVPAVLAQSSTFTYQGRLQDGGTAANGNYDFQFTLWDAPAGGVQQPPTGPITVTQASVQVVNGVFTTQLDFGASAFPGAARFLEISVRLAGGGAFTMLAPRQSITVTPYAIRTASAAAADTATNATNASTATNATQLGGVAAAQYVLTSDSRLSDSRTPTPGSTNYIQNTVTTQAGSNFNISGNGTAGGTLSGNIINATTQFNLGGSRILSRQGTSNLFVGYLAGGTNYTGMKNSFFGDSAGEENVTGSYNAFFGAFAGGFNTTGDENSFFGFAAGGESDVGSRNSFFGTSAGLRNTADGNSFFGSQAGTANTTGTGNAFFGFEAGKANTTAGYNAFFGSLAGAANTTGAENAFFGRRAGELNTQGGNNTFIGWGAGNTNTTGDNNTILGYGADVAGTNLSYATAIGAFATVSTSNTIALGRSAGSDTVRVPGKLVVGTLSAATATHLCINGSDELSACSSSLRYKQNVLPLAAGLNLLQRLRPVTFNWKESNLPDLGLIAEEVAAIEPLLVTRNHAGEIQGVKYDQLNVVLVNAIKQQQEQIKQQQREIESLKKLVCLDHPDAEVCK